MTKPIWSDRECQVVDRLCRAETNKQIAGSLDLSEATVKVHLKAVMRKAGCQDRTAVALLAVAQGYPNYVGLAWAEGERKRAEVALARARQTVQDLDNPPMG